LLTCFEEVKLQRNIAMKTEINSNTVPGGSSCVFIVTHFGIVLICTFLRDQEKTHHVSDFSETPSSTKAA
jgi:hypothetical protein